MDTKDIVKKLICFITCSAVFLCSVICVKTDVFAVNVASKSSPVITEKLYFTYNDITDWYGPTKSINILDDISYLVDLESIVSIDLDVIIPELYNVNWEYNGKNYTSGIYISLNDFKFDTAWGLTTLHSSINVNDLIANNIVNSSFAELSNFDIFVFDINPADPSVVDGLEVLFYFTINYLVDDSNSSGSYDDISDSTSYIFYGDALYELLTSGIWSCTYVVDGNLYLAQPASMSYDTDNYGVVMSFMPESASNPGSLSKSDLILDFNTDYDNVISIKSSVASTLTYKDTFTNTPSYIFAKSAYMGAVDKDELLHYGVTANYSDEAVLSLDKVSYYDFDGSNRYLRENIPLLPLTINNNILKNASISKMSYHVTYNISNMGSVYFVSESICIKSIEFKVEGVMSTKLNAVISALEDTNIKIDKVADKIDGLTYIIGEPTDEDKTALDDLEQDFADVKDKADEFDSATNDLKNDIDDIYEDVVGEEKPDTVIVDLPDEFDVTVTVDFWDLIFGNFIIYRMVFASLGVTVVAVILFGKRG